ncbi:hypothetical protein A4G18_09750 [Pasteurellaceae bacterium Pebbles2]|nr:hypothetical protein [Pasteurellaceae bacterium Pebbles2]
MSAIFNLFYIYDPWLWHFVRMSLVAGVAAVLWLAYKWYKKQINEFVLPKDSLIAIGALLVLSVIPMLINQTSEFGVLAMYVKSLVLFVFGIVIYNLFYQHNQGKTQLVRDLKMGVVVQFSLGLLALIGIPLAISVATGTNAEVILPRFLGSEQEYRLYNFTSSAFFQLSAFYLMLLHFLLATGEKNNNLNPIFVFLILCIGVVSGRTFFLLSGLSLLVYFKLRYLLPIFAFAALVVLLALNYQSSLFIEHALEPVVNLIFGANREASVLIGSSGFTSSSDTLVQKHLFMPEIKQLIMGDGMYFVNGKSYYGGSDSGFVRQALYGGVGYIALCFAFTAYFVKRIADNWFAGSPKFILSTLFLLSVLNVKSDTYAFPAIMFLFLMFLSLFGNKGTQIILSRKNNV